MGTWRLPADALVLISVLWTAVAQTAVAAEPDGAPPRHLLLVTLDTVRADHLGVNGATRVETPHLDRLAAAGANFTRARAPVPLTLPSHASILTGNFPPAHTVRDNGSYRLPEDQVTLAERLRSVGYRTAAFVASFVLDRRFGLAQGFERYDDRISTEPAMLERLDAERRGDLVVSAFEAWLTTDDPGKPFFAWVHLFDAHAPYAPPEPYRSRYTDDPYAGEIAFTDAMVGRMLAALEERGLASRTVVAVVADHGEGLGEHGETTHSLLIYHSTLHVPMLLAAPGLIQPGREIDRLVRTIDLAPTLLDYLELGPELGEGVSLRPLLDEPADPDGGKAGEAPEAYSESLYPRLHLGWSELRGLEAGDLRFILAPERELYDLTTDPGETHNLARERPEVARRLERRLRERMRASSPAEPAFPAALDEADEGRLRALGYLGGGPAPTIVSNVDPKSRMEVWNRIQLSLAQLADGRWAEAATNLEKVVQSEPASPLIWESLASAWIRAGDSQRAWQALSDALAGGVESATIYLERGRLALDRDEVRTAGAAFRSALELDPGNVEALHRLGDLERAAGRLRQAEERYRQALAINPRYLYSRNGLAMTLAALGRDAEAEDAFRTAVDLAPREPMARFNLAVQLERSRRPAEAAEQYRTFLQLAESGDLDIQRRQARAALDRLESGGGPP